VLQIGSAKGVARLLQRAGRSGHAPGRASRITLVPTNTLELVEATAARRAALAGNIEKRATPDKPFDVLVQHLVTVALGGGFREDGAVRRGPARLGLPQADARRVPVGARLRRQGRLEPARLSRVPPRRRRRRGRLPGAEPGDRAPPQAQRRHHRQRLVDAGEVPERRRIGVVEEGFVARLRKGDCFVFAGRTLEFVRAEEMTAYVKRADGKKAAMISWAGAKMPLSSELADAVMDVLADAAQGDFFDPEMEAARPMLETQAHLSRIPTPKTLLIEKLDSREGRHLFLYPFAGRNAHIGLGSLLAWRLSKTSRTPSASSSTTTARAAERAGRRPDAARRPEPVRGRRPAARRARQPQLERARAAALPRDRARQRPDQPGLPGPAEEHAPAAGVEPLFYEVFRKYDEATCCSSQAENEVLSQELDIRRLKEVLRGCGASASSTSTSRCRARSRCR
jgi:ATP-dependent Lhr-like helicase